MFRRCSCFRRRRYDVWSEQPCCCLWHSRQSHCPSGPSWGGRRRCFLHRHHWLFRLVSAQPQNPDCHQKKHQNPPQINKTVVRSAPRLTVQLLLITFNEIVITHALFNAPPKLFISLFFIVSYEGLFTTF